MKVVGAGLLIAILLLPGIAPAAERKSNDMLVLTLKAGRVVEGELLMVKEDRLLLLDSRSLNGDEIAIRDIARIRVNKTKRFLSDFGIGFLVGGALGLGIGIQLASHFELINKKP